jgi:hypothetical protein
VAAAEAFLGDHAGDRLGSLAVRAAAARRARSGGIHEDGHGRVRILAFARWLAAVGGAKCGQSDAHSLLTCINGYCLDGCYRRCSVAVLGVVGSSPITHPIESAGQRPGRDMAGAHHFGSVPDLEPFGERNPTVTSKQAGVV